MGNGTPTADSVYLKVPRGDQRVAQLILKARRQGGDRGEGEEGPSADSKSLMLREGEERVGDPQLIQRLRRERMG